MYAEREKVMKKMGKGHHTKIVYYDEKKEKNETASYSKIRGPLILDSRQNSKRAMCWVQMSLCLSLMSTAT